MKKNKYEILTGTTGTTSYQLPVFLEASVDEMGIMVGFDGEIEQIEQLCNFTYTTSGKTITVYNSLNTNKIKTIIDSVFTISWGDLTPDTDIPMPTVYTPNLPYATHAYVSGGTYDVEITVNSPWKVEKIKRAITLGIPLLDIDGNSYTSIIIGSQEWLAENLKTKRYSDGSDIDYPISISGWTGNTSGAYAYPSGDTLNFGYGLLYNWPAVNNSRGLVYFTRNGEQEIGWRIPTCKDPWNPKPGETYDFEILNDFMGGGFLQGGKLKETGTSHWNPPNLGATNQYGFTALGTGRRTNTGTYDYFKDRCQFWSSISGVGLYSNRALRKELRASDMQFNTDHLLKETGLGVRCVRDVPPPADLGTLTFTIPYSDPSITGMTQDYAEDYQTLIGNTNDTTISFLALGKSRIDELRYYGSSTQYSGLTITAEYTGYTIDGLYYMDYSDGYTHITGATSGYTHEELYDGMITRNEHLIGFLDEPQIYSDIFIERGKQGVMERNLRLGEIDSIGELEIYGSGFFKIKKQ